MLVASTHFVASISRTNLRMLEIGRHVSGQNLVIGKKIFINILHSKRNKIVNKTLRIMFPTLDSSANIAVPNWWLLSEQTKKYKLFWNLLDNRKVFPTGSYENLFLSLPLYLCLCPKNPTKKNSIKSTLMQNEIYLWAGNEFLAKTR